MNRVTDAYRKMRAPADAQPQALSRFAARRSIRRFGWLPVAGFASAVGLAVLIAPIWYAPDWYAPDTQSVELSPVALARLDLRQAPTTFTPSLATLSLPALSELQVPNLNHLSTPNLTVEQETL